MDINEIVMTVLGVCAIVVMVIASISFSIAIVGMTYQMIKDCWKKGFLWSNIRHTKLEMRMGKEDYKRIMRCIEITDHRSKNANVKNLKCH